MSMQIFDKKLVFKVFKEEYQDYSINIKIISLTEKYWIKST